MLIEKNKLKQLIKKKGITSTEDLSSLLRDMTKEVVETLIDGELTDHLGYKKNQKSQVRYRQVIPVMVSVQREY